MAYEKCSSCSGYGMVSGDYNGGPTICYKCKGDTVVRKRNEKGQYCK